MHEKKFLGEKMHEVVHPKSESKHPQSTVLLTLSCPPLNDRCACEFTKMVSLPREAASCCPFLFFFFSRKTFIYSFLSEQTKRFPFTIYFNVFDDFNYIGQVKQTEAPTKHKRHWRGVIKKSIRNDLRGQRGSCRQPGSWLVYAQEMVWFLAQCFF